MSDDNRQGAAPEPPTFLASVMEDRGEVVVAVRGEVDMSSADAFDRAIREAATRRQRIVIDLAETTFMDSSGIAVLVIAHRLLGERRGAVVLRGVGPAVMTTLTACGLDSMLTIEDIAG